MADTSAPAGLAGRSLVPHKLRRAARRVWSVVLTVRFSLPMHPRRPVVDEAAGSVVSLTTYGDRLRRVHLTIESIARGAVRPRRLILWIDGDDAARVSSKIRALQRRGLEVVETNAAWGPHKKYYPYCVQSADEGLLLVTADDDVFYHHDWLRDLTGRARADDEVVWAFRVRRIRLDSRGDLAPYRSWPFVATMHPSTSHLATGVGGVAYPPALQRALRDAGEAFLGIHARTDDIWLHLQELRAGFRVAQVSAKPIDHIEILGSQPTGLARTNQDQDFNDVVLRQTYSSEDLGTIGQAS